MDRLNFKKLVELMSSPFFDQKTALALHDDLDIEFIKNGVYTSLNNLEYLNSIAIEHQSEEEDLQEFIMNDEIGKFKKLLDEDSPLILLTGGAGTGKSTILSKFLGDHILTSTTGVSAIKIGGSTIHSFLELTNKHAFNSINKGKHFKTKLPYKAPRDKEKLRILKEKYLVIDEFSMLRYDQLNLIDLKLRNTAYFLANKEDRLKKNGFELISSNKNEHLLKEPFGGFKIILVGDPFQLPPVGCGQEMEFLKEHSIPLECYKHPVIKKFEKVELKEIYRQKHKPFMELLNDLRVGENIRKHIDFINKNCLMEKYSDKYKITNICFTNKDAEVINRKCLEELDSPEYTSHAEIEGDFPKKYYPLPSSMVLKSGAKIIFCKNTKRFKNGSVGKIISISQDEIIVSIDGKEFVLEKQEWKYEKYSYKKTIEKKTQKDKEVALTKEKVETDNSSKDEKREDDKTPKGASKKTLEHISSAEEDVTAEVTGKFIAYPIRLGYAITAHKSQGMTIEKACLNFGRGAFATGQAYVALSRLKSFSGLKISKPITYRDIKISKDALSVFKKK